MAMINKIIPGYVIQVYDTDTQQYVSQEFVESPYGAVEYEYAEDGEPTDNSWTENAHLFTEMIQPDVAPPLLPETNENKVKWVRWYRETNKGVELKEAVSEYQYRAAQLTADSYRAR